MDKKEISKLIDLAHKSITRTKGNDYAPNVHEIQKWIDNHLSKKSETDVSEKWSEKYKRSIDCNNPKGFSQRAHCQGKKKRETTESMGADASGSFSAPAVGGQVKRKINKINNFPESDLGEATDASSSGSYDVPFPGKTGNPLKIGGPNSVMQSRAVKDKNFPKWGGPEGVFVKVKEKCKKFPYCNQGNTGAIEFYEVDGLKEAVENAAKKSGIPYSEMEKMVINEIKKIFI